jgi:hypothetical protein
LERKFSLSAYSIARIPIKFNHLKTRRRSFISQFYFSTMNNKRDGE